MTEFLRLDEAAVRDFVGPGTSGALLDALERAQLRKRLLQLAFVARRLRRDTPEFYVQSGLSEAYDLLVRSPSDDVDVVASYPSFGRWCSVAARFVANDYHVNLPDGQVDSHLGLLGSFAIVAAARSGDAELEVRFGADGRLCLPTLRLVVEGDLDLAGTRAKCSLSRDGTLEVFTGGRTYSWTSADGASSQDGCRLRVLPLVAGHLELNDVDPLLRVGFGDEDFEWITQVTAQHWRHTLESASKELRQVLPAGAAEVERCVRVLVPLVTRERGVHRSAAAADMSGMIQMSRSTQPCQIAEAMLHEYYHTKLNALLDLDPLLVDESGADAYYSPWRDDPRPLHGVLHGIFSFAIVTRFWQQACVVQPNGVDLDRARHEAVRRHRQVRAAVDELRTHGTPTEVGAAVLDEIARRLDEGDAALEVGPAVSSAIDAQLAGHHARWLAQRRSSDSLDGKLARLHRLWAAAGGRARSPSVRRPVLQSGQTSRALCAALGMERPPDINRVTDRVPRRDLSFDMLGRLSVVDPAGFAERVAVLDAPGCDDLLAELLRGHVAYIAGRFDDAAGYYGRCLNSLPGNVDMWRDFAFAQRHRGRQVECDAFLFQPDLVVRFAETHVLDGETFRRLGVTADDVGHESAPLLLLRWIDQDER
jgi:HEXXH motif-containing protein